jgi:hypothetical protein
LSISTQTGLKNVSKYASNRCRNCDADLASGQAYCGACGQKRISARLTLHEIGHDLLHVVFHVDRSALSLVGMLLLRPGVVALDYVQGRRKRYFGPFVFLFVVVAAASAAVAFTRFRAITTKNPNVIADFLQDHINVLMFAEVPLLAAFTRIIDARGGFNYAEYLVLAAYTSAMRILFFTVIVIPAWYLFRPSDATARHLFYAYLPIWPMYFGFAASRFFPGNRTVSWCKGIAASILTWVSTQGIATFVATLFFRLAGNA